MINFIGYTVVLRICQGRKQNDTRGTQEQAFMKELLKTKGTNMGC